MNWIIFVVVVLLVITAVIAAFVVTGARYLQDRD